ncbi:MAG: homocysteine S-methyltransferase family protein [Sedimentisphaerales bacterium]|nr:homocysteine S-methyltransferase family protein [Sedimentisphaerales bacterium]
MPTVSLKERIKQGLLLLDGGMGTELIARGVEIGTCNDHLNIESPDIILEIQRAYSQAGSDAIITNTFGANQYALARHGLAEEAVKINQAAARIARKAAGEQKYVLGDIGPSGDFLEPLGMLKADDLKKAFTEQAEALLAGGVDGFIIETMTALDEIAVAIEAVKSVSGDLPVLASMSYDKAGDAFRTMMGVDIEAAVSKIVTLDVDAIGFNCGTTTLDEYVELSEKLVSTVKRFNKDLAVSAEPNAGKPELIDGRATYKVTPEDFAATAEKIHALGVSIVGGCCGTTPEHIQAMAQRLKNADYSKV